MQITFFLMASNNIDFWPRVSCEHVQVIFLFVHVIETYE